MKRIFKGVSLAGIALCALAVLCGCADSTMTVEPYTVSYYSSYGTAPDSETLYSGYYLEDYYKDMSYDGKVFIGWRFSDSDYNGWTMKKLADGSIKFYGEDGESLLSSFYVYKKNISLTAAWTDAITITLKNGDETVKSLKAGKGVSTTIPSAGDLWLTKSGYGFKGWSLAASSSKISYYNGGSICPSDDITLYALWAEGKGATPSNIKDVIRSLTTNATVIVSGTLDTEKDWNNYQTGFISNINTALNDVSGILVTLDLEGVQNLTSIEGSYSSYIQSGNLKAILLPSGLKNIGYYAFKECSNLESITLPSSLTTIGSCAFYNCSKLTGEITIPDNVIKIGLSSFEGTGITSANFEHTSGWYKTTDSNVWDARVGGTSISVTDKTEAAKYLTASYYSSSTYGCYLYNGWQ